MYTHIDFYPRTLPGTLVVLLLRGLSNREGTEPAPPSTECCTIFLQASATRSGSTKKGSFQQQTFYVPERQTPTQNAAFDTFRTCTQTLSYWCRHRSRRHGKVLFLRQNSGTSGHQATQELERLVLFCSSVLTVCSEPSIPKPRSRTATLAPLCTQGTTRQTLTAVLPMPHCPTSTQ